MLADHFLKNKERIQKLKETGDSQHVYQNELVKACFKHDTGYGGFKDLPSAIRVMRNRYAGCAV